MTRKYLLITPPPSRVSQQIFSIVDIRLVPAQVLAPSHRTVQISRRSVRLRLCVILNTAVNNFNQEFTFLAKGHSNKLSHDAAFGTNVFSPGSNRVAITISHYEQRQRLQHSNCREQN